MLAKMKPAQTCETIACRTWNSDQSWHHQWTVAVDGHKLRVYIRRNAYDFQSSAKVERWDGTKWYSVCFRPIAECDCASLSYVTQGVTDEDFETDAISLLNEALAIVR